MAVPPRERRARRNPSPRVQPNSLASVVAGNEGLKGMKFFSGRMTKADWKRVAQLAIERLSKA